MVSDSDSVIDEILIFAIFTLTDKKRRTISINDTICKRRQLGEYHRYDVAYSFSL